MATVKNIARHAVDLPDGRLLPPGAVAQEVEAADPDLQAKVSTGLLLMIDSFDAADRKVDDVLEWVGDDPERAGEALAAERARPEREQRSTLIDKLAELVEGDATDESPEEE